MKKLLLPKTAFLLCVLTVYVLSPLLAADAPPLTFRGLAIEGRVEGIYFDNAKGESQEFRASDYVRSDFYKSPGGPELAFYKIIPAEKEGEKPKREVVGTVKWPSGKNPFLVLASHSGEKYAFSAAPDDDESFPMGSFRVINASREVVQVRAAEKGGEVKPGDSIVLRPAPPEEGKGILFQAARASAQGKMFYSNIWSGSQTSRTLVFVVNRANTNYPMGIKRLHESDLVMKYQREKEAQEAKSAQR